MRLTTKGRYAVTAMLDLAIHNDQGPISLADISTRQCISLSYLEQLFARLRKQGLVSSTRGPGGGYTLSRPPAELAIADVISAVDEKLDTRRCGGAEDCQNEERCLTHELWSDLSDRIHTFLANITLEDVMKSSGVQEVAERQRRRVEEVVSFRRGRGGSLMTH
ncbi:transcriptional regulator, BadM/Rrf2 family [Ectothiorhodosinus mongolicus]|uniref:Transcriptional regulator, BadM/Rrf2 family n=1 Tax=Ectothiorhodosinus mongolicus TaxID=233100 RepID=A0A1R3W6K7_9GAMM|nr:Rrf2 family transcriptional regulator [Ectothiorhodosinus mongolicus]ULX57654.1 Fe-S cluster assembly transcriptional regulator IscR [Ectothiorhodosinus mongolicus]SIT73310.1 transcriptional regulator, BadM/Rrf2 family [Ectothiorhodosinus mongolicus]